MHAIAMEPLWPWLAVAAAGALHGLNPVAGWALAAWHAKGSRRIVRALVPIAVGHIASVVLVALAVPAAVWIGMEFDPLVPQGAAAVLLLLAAVRHLRPGAHGAACAGAGGSSLALWSFIAGTAHGAGWMMVPVLLPLCGGDMPGREITASGSFWLALAALGVHMVAMLGTTAAMAFCAGRGVRAVLALRARADATDGC